LIEAAQGFEGEARLGSASWADRSRRGRGAGRSGASSSLSKTGTYAGASTLSGVIHDHRRRLGFSILTNGAPLEQARAAQDEVVAALLRAL